jgi:aconitate hydratase
MPHPDSFGARAELSAGGQTYEIFRLDSLQPKYDVARLPYSLKILLENLLRLEDGSAVTAEDIENLATWVASDEPSKEIAYTPARVLMQDFTGVSTSRRCATRWPRWAATRPRSTRWRRPSS